MTLSAGVSALILDGKVLPVLETAKAVIAVREISAMNSEVIGNQKPSGDDNQSDHSDPHPQWVQYVPLHLRFPKALFERERSTLYLFASNAQLRFEHH
jgi:hypothetical protein